MSTQSPSWDIPMIGRSLDPIRELIAKLAETSGPIQIEGPQGTGKELAARMVVERMFGAGVGPVTINCAHLDPTTAESQLFGHARGAFTDARSDRAGFFGEDPDLPHFLDEVGELPMPVQAKLLRVIEYGDYRRMGEDRVRRFTGRIISASNRDLEALCDQGHFRRELLSRLALHSIRIPALKDRRDDIPELVEYFISKWTPAGAVPIRMTPGVIERLRRHPWPGNVRELEHLVRTCVGRYPGESILAENLAGMLQVEVKPARALSYGEVWAALEKAGNNRCRAAAMLGIGRTRLYELIRQYRIPPRIAASRPTTPKLPLGAVAGQRMPF